MKKDKKQFEIEEAIKGFQVSLNWLESNTITRDDLDQINSTLNYVIKILQEIRGERVLSLTRSKRGTRKLVKQR